MPTLNSAGVAFGDIYIDSAGRVIEAPPATRISLWTVAANPHYAVTPQNRIVVGGHVVYESIDLADAGVLICALVDDQRTATLRVQDPYRTDKTEGLGNDCTLHTAR